MWLKITKLVNSKQLWPNKRLKFNSAYEGYALLLKETEELQSCMSCLNDEINKLWEEVKLNRIDTETISAIYQTSQFLIAEAAVTAAIAQKMSSFREDSLW